MEEKLAAYRARKAKEKASENSLFNRMKYSLSFEAEKNSSCPSDEPKGKGKNDSLRDDVDFTEKSTTDNVDVEGTTQPPTIYWTLVILKVLLWFCVWGIFIELQFGAVYFTVSLILFIYFNTRSGKKDSGLSAYSVFNKDCERIQGTLTAEQMQRNMFSVPGMQS